MENATNQVQSNPPPRVGTAEYAKALTLQTPYAYPSHSQPSTAQALRSHIMSQPSQEDVDVCWFGLTLDEKDCVAFQPKTTDPMFYHIMHLMTCGTRPHNYTGNMFMLPTKIHGYNVRLGPSFRLNVYTPQNTKPGQVTSWHHPKFGGICYNGNVSMGGTRWYNMENPILSDTLVLGEEDVTAPESILSPVCLSSHPVTPINAATHWQHQRRFASDVSLNRVDCGVQSFSVARQILHREYNCLKSKKPGGISRRFSIEVVISKEKIARSPMRVAIQQKSENHRLVNLVKSFPKGVIKIDAKDASNYLHLMIQGETK